ncbi:MAG: hypothetical protein QM731_04690 [Chitinophagaceae bacterium]
MSIQFQSLFTIQVLHDYYNRHDNRCSDLDIVPAEDCAQLMRNMQVLFRNYNYRLLTVINASKEANDVPPPAFKLTPFLTFPDEMVFRYYLFPRNPHFSAITALALPITAKKRLYFSNLSKNKVASTLSLSAPVAVFSVSKIYQPGDLVKGPDDKVYECIRASDGTVASKDLMSTTYWLAATIAHPYAGTADQVVLTGNSFRYTLKTPAANITSKLFGLNKEEDALPFDDLLYTDEQTFPQAQESVSIDLSGFAPGKYRLVVNSEDDVWLYIDQQAVLKGAWGIVEIHHFKKVPVDFSLLTAGNHIKVPEPVFTIWFKNRSVIWKYISQQDAIGITDSGGTPFAFSPASGTVVESQTAIGLTETPVTTLTATRTSTGRELKNLQNPSPHQLVYVQQGDTAFYSGNMYINIQQ